MKKYFIVAYYIEDLGNKVGQNVATQLNQKISYLSLLIMNELWHQGLLAD